MARLGKNLQTKQLDLSLISSLVGAVLHALNNATTPAAYWVLELLDSNDDLQQATGEIVSADKIHTFQETVGTPFLALLKKNISSQFTSHDIVLALHNVPSTDSSQFPTYGKKSIEFLLNHYGKDKFAFTLNDEETVKTTVISPELHIEWLTFRNSLAKEPEDCIAT